VADASDGGLQEEGRAAVGAVCARSSWLRFDRRYGTGSLLSGISRGRDDRTSLQQLHSHHHAKAVLTAFSKPAPVVGGWPTNAVVCRVPHAKTDQ
jgi:hypothetical protein